MKQCKFGKRKHFTQSFIVRNGFRVSVLEKGRWLKSLSFPYHVYPLPILRKSIPRQVDKKSRGPQGERGLEFSRRKKGQTFLSLYIP